MPQRRPPLCSAGACNRALLMIRVGGQLGPRQVITRSSRPMLQRNGDRFHSRATSRSRLRRPNEQAIPSSSFPDSRRTGVRWMAGWTAGKQAAPSSSKQGDVTAVGTDHSDPAVGFAHLMRLSGPKTRSIPCRAHAEISSTRRAKGQDVGEASGGRPRLIFSLSVVKGIEPKDEISPAAQMATVRSATMMLLGGSATSITWRSRTVPGWAFQQLARAAPRPGQRR